MSKAPQVIFIHGRGFKPVETPATGHYQLLELKAHGLYILVNPGGRQAWFHTQDMNEIVMKLGSRFRYTSNPLRDLGRLIKEGLRPLHVDADFDDTGLDTATMVH